MENLPERQFNFPWKYDGTHYLDFSNGDEVFKMRPYNTEMYLFPDQPHFDHIFIQLGEDEGTRYGMRLWRRLVDEHLGEGAFSALCDSLFDHDFPVSGDEEPSQSDIDVYEDLYGSPIDHLVELAMKNFDEAWKYYSEEWGNGENSDI